MVVNKNNAEYRWGCPKCWKIERVIKTEEWKKLKKGCHIVVAYTRYRHKAYKLVGFLRRCPEDD